MNSIPRHRRENAGGGLAVVRSTSRSRLAGGEACPEERAALLLCVALRESLSQSLAEILSDFVQIDFEFAQSFEDYFLARALLIPHFCA
jgi:hypothetical protein